MSHGPGKDGVMRYEIGDRCIIVGDVAAHEYPRGIEVEVINIDRGDRFLTYLVRPPGSSDTGRWANKADLRAGGEIAPTEDEIAEVFGLKQVSLEDDPRVRALMVQAWDRGHRSHSDDTNPYL